MTGNTYLNLTLQELLSEHTKSQTALVEGGNHYRRAYSNPTKDGSLSATAATPAYSGLAVVGTEVPGVSIKEGTMSYTHTGSAE